MTGVGPLGPRTTRLQHQRPGGHRRVLLFVVRSGLWPLTAATLPAFPGPTKLPRRNISHDVENETNSLDVTTSVGQVPREVLLKPRLLGQFG